MKRRPTKHSSSAAFGPVRALGLEWPDVEAATRYDGAPMLKAGGCFMAALASHPSAEPDTLVVRMTVEERQWLLEDAAETYYVTDAYAKYPVVLVRLARVDRSALRDLLSTSRQLALAKAGRRPRQPDRKALRVNDMRGLPRRGHTPR